MDGPGVLPLRALPGRESVLPPAPSHSPLHPPAARFPLSPFNPTELYSGIGPELKSAVPIDDKVHAIEKP